MDYVKDKHKMCHVYFIRESMSIDRRVSTFVSIVFSVSEIRPFVNTIRFNTLLLFVGPK